MSIESAIVTLARNESMLTTILTGGIYGYRELGKRGIDPTNSVTASAYSLSNEFNILQPCCVVKVRSQVVDSTRFDVKSQTTGLRGVVEFWLYDENNYTAIENARAVIYALFQSKTNANIGITSLVNRLDGLRDESLNDAALLRDDYSFTKTNNS